LKTIKELVVLSGKGGTGKTSVTASLACFLKPSVLADCDVDAANLSMLYSVQEKRREDFFGGNEAQINSEKCSACGLCAELCRFDAIEEKGGVYSVMEGRCEGCKLCVVKCPEEAIDWKPAHNGVWMVSKDKGINIFHAELNGGAENSGKLATKVRGEAFQYAEQLVSRGEGNSDLLLIDGPPGIGCPVIASLTGATAALIVTEPTPSGFHDLKRILELAAHFRIPSMILINKADLNSAIVDEIYGFAKGKAEVVGEIPYSELFHKAQKACSPIPELAPESVETELLRDISKKISKTLDAISAKKRGGER
jgi:MinD superfamily P-loop ATPase